MRKKKTQWDITTQLLKWLKLKEMNVLSVGDVIEVPELIH